MTTKHRVTTWIAGLMWSVILSAMVVAQAIATGVFAELQYIGLRKSGGAVAA